MAFWNTIAAARYASGTLFASDITIDLLGRDFGHTVYFDPSIGVNTGSTLEAWTDLVGVWMAYPESWDLDLTYSAFPRISLPVLASLSGAEWADVATFKLRLTSTGEIISVPLSNVDQAVTLVLNLTSSPLPTGLQELKIQYYIEPSAITASPGLLRAGRWTVGVARVRCAMKQLSLFSQTKTLARSGPEGVVYVKGAELYYGDTAGNEIQLRGGCWGRSGGSAGARWTDGSDWPSWSRCISCPRRFDSPDCGFAHSAANSQVAIRPRVLGSSVHLPSPRRGHLRLDRDHEGHMRRLLGSV